MNIWSFMFEVLVLLVYGIFSDVSWFIGCEDEGGDELVG